MLDIGLNIEEGSFLGQNHKVIQFLGEGCYGYVYKCLNTKTNKMEALKISKIGADSISMAQKEIAILKHLRRLDPDACSIIKCYGFFPHGEHICLRFELLDQTLEDYMKERHKQGLPLPELRPIIQQLATALSHLSSVGIIHADIKPENVMVVDRLRTPLRVKLIDFGVAHPVSAAEPESFVQDMSYMPPEALVGSPYNEAVDMWSLGLTAAELATGIQLYPGNTEYEMLRFISETQGQPSDSLLDCGMDTDLYFKQEDGSHQRWRLKTPGEFGFKIDGEHPRSHQLKCLDDLQELMCEDHKHQQDQNLLLDLIKRMLHLDQNQRIKPQEVLQHSFFNESLPETSETITSMETVNEGTEVLLESSTHQTAGTEDTPCIGTTTVSLAAEWKEDTGDVQPETRAQNGGSLLRRLIRMIMDTFCCFTRTK